MEPEDEILSDDETFASAWKISTESLKPKILQEAKKIAADRERTKVTTLDVIDATRLFASEDPAKRPASGSIQKDGWINRNVTGFIGITALLAIAFGLLGLIPAFIPNVSSDYAKLTSGFIEISKIFAGALVGGAAGAAVTTAQKR